MNRHFFAPTTATHTSQLLLIAAAAAADVVIAIAKMSALFCHTWYLIVRRVLILLCITMYTCSYAHIVCVSNNPTIDWPQLRSTMTKSIYKRYAQTCMGDAEMESTRRKIMMHLM